MNEDRYHAKSWSQLRRFPTRSDGVLANWHIAQCGDRRRTIGSGSECRRDGAVMRRFVAAIDIEGLRRSARGHWLRYANPPRLVVEAILGRAYWRTLIDGFEGREQLDGQFLVVLTVANERVQVGRFRRQATSRRQYRDLSQFGESRFADAPQHFVPGRCNLLTGCDVKKLRFDGSLAL